MAEHCLPFPEQGHGQSWPLAKIHCGLWASAKLSADPCTLALIYTGSHWQHGFWGVDLLQGCPGLCGFLQGYSDPHYGFLHGWIQ